MQLDNIQKEDIKCATVSNRQARVLATQLLSFMEKNYTITCSYEVAAKALSHFGCQVSKGGQVQFPRQVIEHAIATTPREVTFRPRTSNGKRINISSFSQRTLITAGMASRYRGIGERSFRRVSLKDIGEVARLIEGLSNISLITNRCQQEMDRVHPLDELLAVLNATRKPFVQNISSLYSMELVKKIWPLLQKFFPQSYGVLIQSDSEECWDALTLKLLCTAVGQGIPVLYILSIPRKILISPSKEGLFRIGSQLMSALILTQAIQEAAPVVLGVRSAGDFTLPEFLGQTTALCAIMKEYGIPLWADVCTNAMNEGNLWVQEISFALGLGMLSNLPVITLGSFDAGAAMSATALAIIDEVGNFVNRTYQTYPFDKEAFAMDAIKNAGPGGNFLSSPHTYNMFRSVIWEPSLMNKQSYEQWEKTGKPSLITEAEKKTENLFANTRVCQLPKEFVDEIEKIKLKNNQQM